MKAETTAKRRAREIAGARKVCKNSRKIAIFRELAQNFVRFSRTCFAQAGKCWCMLSTPQTLTMKAETTAKRRAREIPRARKVCKNSRKITIFRELARNFA